eukprot:4614312-Heterocapsa_arctica.AAC.1
MCCLHSNPNPPTTTGGRECGNNPYIPYPLLSLDALSDYDPFSDPFTTLSDPFTPFGQLSSLYIEMYRNV